MSDDGRSWQDLIIRDRMEVDQQFAERVRQSDFSNQEWNLIMTAVELEIREGEEGARLVADTSRIESIMPELERIQSQAAGGMGGPGSGGSGGGGLLGSIKSSLGLGGGVDRDRLEEATDLSEAYATALQTHLEDNGKWERVRQEAV